jgi:lipopolysaccharide export system permease protein
MRILRRYIGATVINTILIVVLVLIAVEIFIEFTGEFSDMGTGNYGLPQVLLCVAMRLPADIYQFFPMAGLVGSLMGLGLLASHSELVIMRASGVSLIKITWAVIKAAFLTMLVAIVLGEVIAPFLQHSATSFKAQAMSHGQALHTQHGIWIRNGGDFLYVDTTLPNGQLKDVTRYQFDDNHHLRSASYAKQAVYDQGKWIFNNVAESVFLGNRIISKHYDNEEWKLTFNPRLLNLIDMDNDQRSLPQLYSYIKYLQSSDLQANEYEFDFWQRVFQPAAILVMILLSVPFIFGPLRTVTMGLRILAGTVTGFTFYILNQCIGLLSTVYQLSPLATASLPTILVAILGFILLLRVK